MERIKGKHDDITNKIRPGTTYVAGFTQPGNNDNLRAIDSDGALMQFEPVSRYYASCTIKRGQAVSIAQLADLQDYQRDDKYPYIKITDPDLDESCLGIAMNYAEEGQIVHVQRSGKFNYYTTTSLFNTLKRAEREIFLKTTEWSFDEVRGQKLYVKKLYNNTTKSRDVQDADLTITTPKDNEIVEDTTTSKKLRNKSTPDGIQTDTAGDAFDTDHTDINQAADDGGWFTYEFINSVYNVKNTIQVGYLTDAPTVKPSVFDENKFVALEDGTYTYDESLGTTPPTPPQPQPTFRKPEFVIVDRDPVNTEVIRVVDLAGNIVNEPNSPKPKRVPKPHEKTWIWRHKTESGNIVYELVDDQIVTVELDVTGDTRGPLDNTQFVVTLGETIYFESKKQDRKLISPHYNQGIFDELKVLAIAQGNPRSPSFRVFNSIEVTTTTNPLKQGFIAVRKLDGDTHIIPILCQLTEDDLNALIDVNDEGYYKLSKQFTGGPEREIIETINGVETKVKSRPTITIGTPVVQVNREKLKIAVSEALQRVFIDEEVMKRGCQTTVYDIGNNGFSITTDKHGGYYDVYVSHEVLSLVTVTQVEHGQVAPAGTAILADIRDANRLNVVGVVTSNNTGVRRKGETVKVMKMGRIVTLGNIQPGLTYFLGLNGRLTAREQFWYDHCLPVGLAESSNYFLVDVGPVPVHNYSGNFPLGYLKPSIYGSAEKGFVLTDGTTVYSKEQYPELYQTLLNWFNEDELKPSNVTKIDYDRLKNIQIGSVLQDILSKLKDGEQLHQDFKKEFLKKLDYLSDVDHVHEQIIKNLDTKFTKKDEEQDKALQDYKKKQAEIFERYKEEQAILNQRQTEEYEQIKKDLTDDLLKAIQAQKVLDEKQTEELKTLINTLKLSTDTNIEEVTRRLENLKKDLEKSIEKQADTDDKQTKNLIKIIDETLDKAKQHAVESVKEYEEKQKEIDEKQDKELKKLEEKNTEQDTAIEEAEESDEINRLQTELTNANTTISTLNEMIKYLQTKVQQSSLRIRVLRNTEPDNSSRPVLDNGGFIYLVPNSLVRCRILNNEFSYSSRYWTVNIGSISNSTDFYADIEISNSTKTVTYTNTITGNSIYIYLHPLMVLNPAKIEQEFIELDKGTTSKDLKTCIKQASCNTDASNYKTNYSTYILNGLENCVNLNNTTITKIKNKTGSGTVKLRMTLQDRLDYELAVYEFVFHIEVK